MKKILFLFLIFISSNVQANTAYDLYMSGNKAEGIAKWQDEAKNGNSAAKYVIGMLYNDSAQLGLCEIEDFCVFKKFSNYRKAKKIFEELYSEEGDPRAAYALAEYYDDHPLIITNYKKAAQLYLFAAERGVPEAQYNIANMFERGDGVKKDLIQSVRWYLQCNVSSLCAAGQEGIDDLIIQLTKEEFEYAKSLINYDMKDIDIRITVGR
ncbi:MAG: hypothetical protein CMI87_01130 [Pelagibacteraceae bacterium]|nr:hypothetical protein [Pelagibacteraceae bacterium]